MKKIFVKKIVPLVLAATVVTSVFNGLALNVSAADDGTAGLYFPDGTPVNVNSKDFDSSEDYSGYGMGIENEDEVRDDLNASDQEVLFFQTISETFKSGSGKIMAKKASGKEYPRSIDLSTSKYFPAIGNQRSINSCTAWAIGYYGFTYEYCRINDLEAKGDNIMSPAFIYNQAKTTSGGSSGRSIYTLLREEGIPSFSMADFETYYSDYSCRSWFPKKEIWENASKHRLSTTSYLVHPGQITSNSDTDLYEMKKYLNQGHVINFSTTMDNSINGKLYKTSPHAGEICRIASVSATRSHEMTIVGYDDDVCCDINNNGKIEEAEKGAFKVANSWGEAYGNSGYIWFLYDSINKKSDLKKNVTNRISSVDDMWVMNLKAGKDQSSGLYIVTDLNTKRRDESFVWVIAKDKATGEVKETQVTPFFMNNFNKCSMDGLNGSDDGEIAFDLNNVIKDISIDNYKNYEWSVRIKDLSNDGYAFTLKDAYIESKGQKLDMYLGKEISVNGETLDLSFLHSGRIWADKTGEEALIGSEITLNACINTSDKNVTYKFSEVTENEETVLRDYSSKSGIKWIPDTDGDHHIRVYIKADGEIFTFDETFTINSMPYIYSFDYDTAKCFVDNKITFTAEFDGGIGKKKFEDVYVYGGKYSKGKKTIHLDITDDNEAVWIPDRQGDYLIYAVISDERNNKSTVKAGEITISKRQPLKIDDLTIDDTEDIGVDSSIILSAEVSGGSGEYEYIFGLIYDGVEYSYNCHDNDRYSGRIYNIIQDDNVLNVGKNTFFVDVKDKKTGETLRKTIDDIYVKGMEMDLYCNVFGENKRIEDELICGESIWIYADIYHARSAGEDDATIEISKDNGKTFEKITTVEKIGGLYRVYYNHVDTCGDYIVRCKVTDSCGQMVQDEISFKVVEE